jgi:hypothetical protein
MKAIYATPSNAAFYQTLLEDAVEGETNWTVNRHARRGDVMLLYVCAPVSAIVARATLATDPELNDDPACEWFGSYMADMHSLTMLAEPITRAALLRDFPQWGYWKQPHNSARVPKDYEAPLLRILERT